MWPNSFKEVVWKTDFNDITCFGSKICKLISWVNDATCENSFDGVHENLGVLDLLLNEVTVPGSDSVVVDGNALVGSGVEELNLVGGVHAHWVSD